MEPKDIQNPIAEQDARDQKFDCSICKDKGFIEKTEWTGTDDSYDVQVRCECNETEE